MYYNSNGEPEYITKHIVDTYAPNTLTWSFVGWGLYALVLLLILGFVFVLAMKFFEIVYGVPMLVTFAGLSIFSTTYRACILK